MFDIDKGLKGSLVHHKPLTPLQLKRLLLVFDELHLTPPSDNRCFLENGSICYHYKVTKEEKYLYSVDGFDLLKKMKNVKPPKIGKDQIEISQVLNHGTFRAFTPPDILAYYKNDLFEKYEVQLLDRFEKAIDKKHIKILEYRNSDFYVKNSIPLKIAYDFDVCDSNSLDYVKKLFVNEKTKRLDKMFYPSPSLVELEGFNYFPRPKYNSQLREIDDKLEYDYERQYFSIIAKVNKKLALTNEFNLIPIFIDNNIHNFYQYKIEKSKKNKDLKFQEEWGKIHDNQLFNLSNLIFKSSNIFIKDNILNQISISQILSYKERCIDELYSLRKELFGDLNCIINSDYNKSDMVEIEKLIGRKIIPEFYNYQESQNNLLEKTTKKIFKYGVGIASASFGYAQGLSPLLIAVLSGTSPSIAEDLLQLSGKLKDKKKRKYENTFSYFLNLNNHK